MSHPIPTPTEAEINDAGGVEVVRGGKAVKADLRIVASDIAAALAREFGGDKLILLFKELSQATCVTNGGKIIPDNRTRLAASVYIGNQLLGTPIARSEAVNVNLDADSAIGMRERLAHSPALRAMLRGMLEEVEQPPNPE